MMRSLFALCSLLAGLAICNGKGGTISFRLNRYSNPEGKGMNGNCCDGIFPVCKKSSKCDQYFIVCFDNPDSSNNRVDPASCPLGRYETGVTEQNVITFGGKIGTTPNPKTLPFDNAWPYNVKIKVHVWDEDGNDWLGNPNDDDLVDKLSTIQSIHPDGHANTITLAGRTSLVATITVNCNKAGMSDDCETPLPPTPPPRPPPSEDVEEVVNKTTVEIVTDPPSVSKQCYECSTRDMTELDEDYQAQWEEFTKRDMSYVQVSPQCQDVAAVPEQFLQNCEGVCITGLWALDKSFIFRTCVAVTKSCEDIEEADEQDEAATYDCSTERKGNNERHLIEGVPLPATDATEGPPEEAELYVETVEEDYEETGTWLSCYQCNSLYDKAGQCEDPFGGEIERVNCTLKGLEKMGKLNITLAQHPDKGVRCHKSVVSHYDSKTKAETKIVKRECGYTDTNYCEYERSPGGQSIQCYCDEHDCNSAAALKFGIVSIFLGIFMISFL